MIKFGTVKKKCHFCVNGIKDVDFKDTDSLQKFTSAYGKIMPKKRTKLCAKHQRKVTTSIKRARIMALLPFVNR
jgi:small subunit ribosomal protein S18